MLQRYSKKFVLKRTMKTSSNKYTLILRWSTRILYTDQETQLPAHQTHLHQWVKQWLWIIINSLSLIHNHCFTHVWLVQMVIWWAGSGISWSVYYVRVITLLDKTIVFGMLFICVCVCANVCAWERGTRNCGYFNHTQCRLLQNDIIKVY